MEKIVRYLTLLVALMAFCVTMAIGLVYGVRPLTAFVRATIAMGIFGVFGIVFFQIIAKSVISEMVRIHKENTIKQRQQQQQQQQNSLANKRKLSDTSEK